MISTVCFIAFLINLICICQSTDQQKSLENENIAMVLLLKQNCQAYDELKKLWEDLAPVFEGHANFVTFHQESGIPKEYETFNFPSVKIYHKNTKKIVDYKKPITAEDVFRFTTSLIDKSLKDLFKKAGFVFRDGYVIYLGDQNFTAEVENSPDHYLIEFFAPWCGHCKALKPAYEDAAKKLHGKMKLVAVDCTVNEALARQFNIRGFPTLKFIPAHSKNVLSAIDYTGGRTSAEIVSWAEAKIASLVPPPELVQVTSQAEIESECFSKSICVLTFFPNRLDSNAKMWNKYISSLNAAIEKVKTRNFGWVWLEGNVHKDLEESFGVGDFGYPAVLALNFKKKAFSTMKSAFDADSIKKFVDSLGARSTITQTISDNVPPIKDQSKWDGSEFPNTKSDL